METKICSQCGRELPITEYYSRGGGRYRSECKDCHKKYVAARYEDKKLFLQNYKSSIGCAKCGEKRGCCLDFHHIDPSIKDEAIARMTSNKSNINDIMKETEKCVVLCANCHREFHFLEHNIGITLEQYLSDTPESSSGLDVRL